VQFGRRTVDQELGLGLMIRNDWNVCLKAEAIPMEFKEGQYKGLREVGRRLSDYTKHAWNKDDEAFNLIVQVLSILNVDSCIISCAVELVFILYISCHVNFGSCLDRTYIFPIYMIRCAKTMKRVLFT
jgi:hypothetical protein